MLVIKKVFKFLTLFLFANIFYVFGQKNSLIIHNEVKNIKVIINNKDTLKFNEQNNFIKPKSESIISISLHKENGGNHSILSNVFNTVAITNPLDSISVKSLDKTYFIPYQAPFDTLKKRIYIQINDPKNSIKDGTIIGLSKNKEILKSSGQLLDPVFGSKKSIKKTIYRAIDNSVFDCNSDEESINFKYSNRPYLEVNSEIVSFDFVKNAIGFDDSNNGKFRDYISGVLKMKWKVNYKNKTIYQLTTKTCGTLYTYDIKEFFEFLAQKSAQSFLLNDNSYQILYKSQVSITDSLNSTKINLKANQNKTKDSKIVIKEAMKSVITVHDKEKKSHGSGFIISSDGYILTNYHVISETAVPKIQFGGDTTCVIAKIIKVDIDKDIALMKIEKTELSYLELDSNKTFEIGENVFAIGTPGFIDLTQSVTKGIISSLRKIKEHEFIQSDVSVSPGNSGGPLISENGNVLGIVSWYLPPYYGFQGISFIVPTKQVLKSLSIVYLR